MCSNMDTNILLGKGIGYKPGPGALFALGTLGNPVFGNIKKNDLVNIAQT